MTRLGRWLPAGVAGLFVYLMAPTPMSLAQAPSRHRLIAFLEPGPSTRPTPVLAWMRETLAELGWVEGRTARFETRYADKFPNTSPVAAAFDAALRGRQVEAPDGSAAVAAGEVVAAAVGRPHPNLPSELRTWVQLQSHEQLARLAPLARRALARVVDPTVSELQKLWSESNPRPWRAAIADLESRLGK